MDKTLTKTVNNIIKEEEIIEILKVQNPSLSETSLKWEMFHYIKNNHLTRIGEKKFIKHGRKYVYQYQSQLTPLVDNYLCKQYPDIRIVLWESIQLNEWLNLLINTNVIYVEVEKEYIDFVFSSLNDHFGKEHLVLLNPDDKMISQYLRKDLIVVKTLYSKSPLSKKDRKIRLEKLIIDILSKDYSFDTKSLEDIISGIKGNYDIDVDRMLSYASRRRIKDKVTDIWEPQK